MNEWIDRCGERTRGRESLKPHPAGQQKPVTTESVGALHIAPLTERDWASSE